MMRPLSRYVKESSEFTRFLSSPIGETNTRSRIAADLY